MGYQLSPEIAHLTRRLDEHAAELESLLMRAKNLPASAAHCVQRAKDLRVAAKMVRNLMLISHGVEQRDGQTCSPEELKSEGAGKESSQKEA